MGEEHSGGERIKRCSVEKRALELSPKGLVGVYQTSRARGWQVRRHEDVKS